MKRKNIMVLLCAVIIIGVASFTISNILMKSKPSNKNQTKEKVVTTINNSDEQKAKLEEEKKKLDEEKAKLEQERQKVENEKLKQENERLKKENANTYSKREGSVKINNSKESYLHMANFANGVYVEGANAWDMMNIDGVGACMYALENVAETYSREANKRIKAQGVPKETLDAFNSLTSELKRLKATLTPVPNDNATTATLRKIEHVKKSVDDLAREILAVCEQHGVHPNCG